MFQRRTLAAALVTASCSAVDSSTVETAALYADLAVTSEDGTRALATAALKVGGPTSTTFVTLSDGDRLEVTGSGRTATMDKREGAGAVWYEATLPGAAADAAVDIAFTRQEGLSAPDSRATMPAPFAITAPAADAIVSRDGELRLAWSPGGTADGMRWSLAGTCILPAWGDVRGDPGAHVIERNRILPVDAKIGATCAVTLELLRMRPGRVSAAYGKGGTFVGRQRRTVVFRSAP